MAHTQDGRYQSTRNHGSHKTRHINWLDDTCTKETDSFRQFIRTRHSVRLAKHSAFTRIMENTPEQNELHTTYYHFPWCIVIDTGLTDYLKSSTKSKLGWNQTQLAFWSVGKKKRKDIDRTDRWCTCCSLPSQNTEDNRPLAPMYIFWESDPSTKSLAFAFWWIDFHLSFPLIHYELPSC